MSADRRGTDPPASTAPSPRPDTAPDRQLLARVAEDDLSQAVAHVDIPLVVWDESGTIQLANPAAAELAGRTLGELVGTLVKDYASPSTVVEQAIASLVAGQFDEMRSRRSLHDRSGEDVPVLATSKAIEVDGRRGGVTMFVPRSELGRLGLDTDRQLDLVPVSVGVARTDWVITAVSSEVRELLERAPESCIGKSLLSFVHPDDAFLLAETEGEPPSVMSYPRVRFAMADGLWREVCVLVAPARGRERLFLSFALVGQIDDFVPAVTDRVEELEMRLRRIGAEVRAAGLIAAMEPAADLHEFPQLGELTTRQWEVLHRLLEGERVTTIANELYISRSTVRNHLATIFQKFGVHTQAELIELLKRPKA